MQFKDAQESTESKDSYEITYTGPIIGYNKVMGHFDCSLVYKVHHNNDPLKLSTIDYEADMVDSEEDDLGTN